MQWDGRFHSAESIARTLNGHVVLWPVPRGYEHRLRRKSEEDRSRGDILDTAPAFLVVYGLGHEPVRVDAGQWFVIEDDKVTVLTGDEFAATYEAVSDV